MEVPPDVGEEGLQAGGFGVGFAGAAEEDLVGADCGGVFVVVDFEEEAGGCGVGGEELGCVCEGCVGEGLGEECGEGGEDEPAGWRGEKHFWVVVEEGLNSKVYICRTAVKLGESDFKDIGYRQSDVYSLAKRDGMKPSDNSSARKHEEVKETG